MLEKIFILWIIFQLLMIGFAGASIENKITKNIYECPKKDFTFSRAWGLLLPLTMFVPEQKSWNDYCDLKNK
jgi:hypothetical protein